jgi:hypothetical protein
MLTITIVVLPVGRGRFAASLEATGRLLVTSRTPFLDAARVLLAEGHDPASVLQTHRPDRAVWDLRATIGRAARLTVREDNGPPQFAPYRPPVFRTGYSGATIPASAGPPPTSALPDLLAPATATSVLT